MRAMQRHSSESGLALLMTLIVLSVFSLLGLYLAAEASTELRISSNHESRLRATYAAVSGLSHARNLFRGIPLGDILEGFDGVHDSSAAALRAARQHRFRNPLTWEAARTLNVLDPSNAVSGGPDDGLLCRDGQESIPASGIALMVPGSAGGMTVASRYFVKVADNNGQVSETAGDRDDDPFVDGDGTVLVRSMGIARDLAERTGSIHRLNSVALFEARLRRLFTFDLGPALTVLGTEVNAEFAGNFEISGDRSVGIGVLDTNPRDESHPDRSLQNAFAVAGSGRITGQGLNPSIQQIAGDVEGSSDRALLLNPGYLWRFTREQAPRFADAYYRGDQVWSGHNLPYLGVLNPSEPWNASGQNPRITVVEGNLALPAGLSGGGVLIVTGDVSCSGICTFNGLVLVIGSGRLMLNGAGPGIQGAVFVARIVEDGGPVQFDRSSIVIGGWSRIAANHSAVQMALSLLPMVQTSFREVMGYDP